MIHALFFTMALGLVSAPLVAETPPSDQSATELKTPDEAEREDTTSTFMDLDQRIQLYDVQKKNRLNAIGLSLLLPGLGNIYAEQYFIAAIAMSLTVFALVFSGYALATDQPKFFIWSATTAGVAYVGGLTTSVIGVDRYNADLRSRLKIPAEHASGIPSAPLTLSFSVAF